MDIQQLNDRYQITVLCSENIPDILQLCMGNPLFYQHCPPLPSAQSIWQDMHALPTGKTAADKYYLGFWEGEKLIAVLDLILRYPDEQTAFIGFFMLNAEAQGKGLAAAIIHQLLQRLKNGFSFVRLGYVQSNCQSERFWKRMGFEETGTVTRTDSYQIVIAQKKL